MNNYLVTNGPFAPTPARETPIATQDKHITIEEQKNTMAAYLIGTHTTPINRGATEVAPVVFHQATLMTYQFTP